MAFPGRCFSETDPFRNGCISETGVFPKRTFSETSIFLDTVYIRLKRDFQENMPLTTNAVKKEETKFITPFRIILSGSSGAGKTYFAEKLLESNLFNSNFEYIYYFHPCYLEEAPVNWHKTMSIPVSYQTGLPSLEQLMSMPPNSVIVLDDLMDKCNESEVIDQLFRVVSGKKRLSVMIMTQNYFAQGKYGRNIRNSCNYTVLLRNCCDATINRRAARAMGLTKPFALAERDNAEMEYPYIFLDQSQKGQVSGYQTYTNIFDRYRKCYSNAGMPSYIIPEKDFLNVFKILQAKNRIVLAQEKNENEIENSIRESTSSTTTGSSSTDSQAKEANTEQSDEIAATRSANRASSFASNSASRESTRPKPYSRRERKRPKRYL